MCGYADTLGRGPQLETHFSLVLLLVAGTLNWWAFHPSPVLQGFGRAVRNSFAWQTTAFVERSDSNQPGQFKERRLEYCVCDTWAAKTQATEKNWPKSKKKRCESYIKHCVCIHLCFKEKKANMQQGRPSEQSGAINFLHCKCFSGSGSVA